MALTPCPECEREISTAAEACPHCGYPLRKSSPAGPACYSCERPATTRCHKCGTMSCAEHVQNIYVGHNHGGAYELRCASCYSSAMVWKMVGLVFGAVIFAVVLIILANMVLR